MKTAACLILVCGLSLGGLLAVSPGVRAWTKNVFVQWFEDYFYIAYAGQQAEGVKASDWRPAYVPDGFETVDTQDEAFSITYENSDGVWIKFRCTTVAVAGDSERGTFSGTDSHGGERGAGFRAGIGGGRGGRRRNEKGRYEIVCCCVMVREGCV